MAIIAEFSLDIDDPAIVGTRHNLLWIEKLNKGLLFDTRKLVPASHSRPPATYNLVADASMSQGSRDASTKGE
jgi:hypothetical protein